jgi:hypothetical protein
MRSGLKSKSAVYAGEDAMDLSSWESSTCPIEINEGGWGGNNLRFQRAPTRPYEPDIIPAY